MSFFLSQKTVSSSACAKAILIGEHAAVYGFPALAVGLPDVRLHVEIAAPQLEKVLPERWEDAFEVEVRGQKTVLSAAQRQKLAASLATCIFQNGGEFTLQDFRPQPIRIRSEIPLGAGMGGSAALSTALVRLIDRLRSREPIDLATRANLVDSVFHGVASGLDTAAIAGDGTVVEFVRNRGAIEIYHPTPFWLVLVDSGTRAATSEMVGKVAELRRKRPAMVDEVMEQIGEIAAETRRDIENGRISETGRNLNKAHELLSQLGVSTPELDAIVEGLRNSGAAGAKLTGGGGGGVVLALFDHDPVNELLSLAQFGQVFYTRVSPTSFERHSQGENREQVRAFV